MSNKSMHEVVEHQEAMNNLEQESIFMKASMMKPRTFIDGNQWCLLYGENLMDGIAGFGDSLYEALLSWDKEWFEKLSSRQVNA